MIPSGRSTADLTALEGQLKYALHYNCIRIIIVLPCSENLSDHYQKGRCLHESDLQLGMN